jgi:hypothetical protein
MSSRGCGRGAWQAELECSERDGGFISSGEKTRNYSKKKKKWRSEDFRINGLSEEFGIWMAQMSEPGLPDGLFSNQKFKFG